MTKRLDDVAETRQRIVEATVELHGTVGPARTTIAGIAERAGVTRLTVYRHFPDVDALFAACSAHWYAQQPSRPDPVAWQAISDPTERLRVGLADLYRFFRNGAPTLTLIYADWDALPPAHQQGMLARNAAMRDALVDAFPRASKRLRAVVGHATAFATWRSLCHDNGLPDKQAVDVMTTLVLAVSASRTTGEARR
jgi:AcrR family transcriptional regulator